MCLSTPARTVRAPSRHLRAPSTALTVALLGLAATPAAAEPCRLAQAAELPVTMEGTRPMVHAAINGKDALFFADSGAFFSMLSPAGARQFNLSLGPAPPWFSIKGVGGTTQAWMTTVQTFTIFNMDLHRIPFFVAGNDLGHGAVGLLGQNVFRLGDVEYDLANGVIAILRTHGDCRKAALAYWANAKGIPYSVMEIDFATPDKPHTTGEAYLNGSRIRVVFDTGAGASMLSLDAVRHAGVTLDSPGVTPAGSTSGVGRRSVRTWIAPFASFKIGDEEIRNTHLRFSDADLAGFDMLIGPDFFLSHHILVASSQHKLYFTYNGGPVFNLMTMPESPPATASADSGAADGALADGGTAAAPEPGAPMAPAAAATQPARGESLDAGGYARRGSAFAARRDYEHALADLDKAIGLDPTRADYFYERGLAHQANRQQELALEDFSQAIRLAPDDVPALIARAELHTRRNDPPDIITPDLDAADRAAPKADARRLALADLYQRLRNYRAAITQYDDWIGSHNRDDIRMPHARNERCWARALVGTELDMALDDCNFAVHASPKVAAYLDSRGLVYLRQGKYDKAVGDYDAVLALNPKSAWSLYGRGLAKQHLGQTDAGAADITAAKAIFPKIAEEAASHGIGQ